MSLRVTILYLFLAGCPYATTATAMPHLIPSIAVIAVYHPAPFIAATTRSDSCPITCLTSISFQPYSSTLTKSAKALLRQAIPVVLSCDSCRIRLTVSDQTVCFPRNRKARMNNQVGWNRAMKTSDFLCNTLHYPSDRVFFGFRENDTTNRVILTCVTESELPSKPAPHPNLRNRDTISRDTLTVHFGVNQSSLSGASDSIIDEYIRKIGGTRQLHIAGYCDNTGPEAYNDKLSLNRAQTVNNYLRQHWPDSIINTNLTAYGTRYPIDDNSTASGRARNRRVTIIAAQPRSATQPPAASAQPATTQTKGSIYNALTDTTTRTGTTIVLKDVVFYGGRRIPLPASYIALGELLKAMTDNTNLRIRIEGHVCCIPDSTDGPDLDTGQPDLSVQRAKFVFDYLLKQGIPENRLAYIGLGGSGKRYPEELNPAQQSANRRVEIRIMSK